MNDVTQRKKAEQLKYLEKQNLILESLHQITFSASPEGAFSYFNDFFLEYSGMTLKMALEKGYVPILNAQQVDEVLHAWEHSLTTLENFNVEFQLKRKSDGMYRWHVCRASAVVTDEGKVIAWVGAATDVEDQKDKEKAKDEFISIASHELKTPLTVAKAFVQLIEHSMKGKDDDNLLFAEKASASIDRLHRLIGELLDVSKIQQGQLGLNISTFSFDKMINSAIESVQVSKNSHKIIQEGKTARDVNGDEERLRQVVVNILNNAIKYSPKSDQVYIKSTVENNNIKVAISDSGIGINKKNLNKVFDRYYREEGRAIRYQGLGIGLSISAEIIKRHKGKMWAESEPGKGSTFFFTLPIKS